MNAAQAAAFQKSHPDFAARFGLPAQVNEQPDLSEGIRKVFPLVNLHKAEKITADDSITGLARKILKKLSKGSSDADRVHEAPKQFKVGEKFTYGTVEVTLIDADAKTFTLKLPNGSEAIVPATVDLALASSDPAAFLQQCGSLVGKPVSTLRELMEISILADDGDLTGTLKAMADKNGDISDAKLAGFIAAKF